MSSSLVYGIIISRLIMVVVLALFPAGRSEAGGGLVLEEDACIVWIDFYSAHLTTYQPDSAGNQQFCKEVPGTGATIFVLDYLHQSLKEVPVDFRIIRNATGQGQFVNLRHVADLGELEPHTVFYQPPGVHSDASLKVEYEFREEGSYVGIVSAGHPTNDSTYMAAFPIEVGGSGAGIPLAAALVLIVLALWLLRRRRAAPAVHRPEGGS